MQSITRRQVFIAAGAVIAAGGAGALGASAIDHEVLAKAVLTRLLGPFEMDQKDFQAFTAAAIQRRTFPKNVKFLAIAEKTGIIDTILDHSPISMVAGYDQFRRRLMTDFMLSTGFLEASPRALTFTEISDICYSPFAQFE